MLQKKWEIKIWKIANIFLYFCWQIQFRLQQGFSNDKKVCDTICWILEKEKPSNNGNIYIIQSVDNHKGNEKKMRGSQKKMFVDDNLYLWMLTEMWNINILTVLGFSVFFNNKKKQEHGAKVYQ